MADFSNLRYATKTDLEHLIATGRPVLPGVILNDLQRTRRLDNHLELLSDTVAFLSAKPRLPSRASLKLADRFEQITKQSDLQIKFLQAIAAFLRGEFGQRRGRPSKTRNTQIDGTKLASIASWLKVQFEDGLPFDEEIWSLLDPKSELSAVRGRSDSAGLALASTATAMRHLGLGTRSEQSIANLISKHKRANLM